MFGNCSRKTNSPLLRHIIAKLFYKIILHSSNLSVILPQCGNCGAVRAWGVTNRKRFVSVRGEARFPPFILQLHILPLLLYPTNLYCPQHFLSPCPLSFLIPSLVLPDSFSSSPVLKSFLHSYSLYYSS